MPLSDKQKLSITEATHAMNIWVGAVRSGKTCSSIISLIDVIKNGPPGDVMIIGFNRATVQRNVLHDLYKMLGFSPPPENINRSMLYGRNVYFVGAPDVSAVATIQGSTLAIAYVDEATKIPQPFWEMLITRLSVPGARLLATCNPEGPSHWLKKNYINKSDDPALDLKHWSFTLEDNPSLDDAYKARIKASFTGMFYRRYVLGEWALATGLVYDCFDDYNLYEDPKDSPNYYIMGLDYGTTNATAAVLLGVRPNRWPQITVEEEYYYDSVVKGRSKTDAELVNDIRSFIGYRNVSAIYIDPAAASLKIAMRQVDLPVVDAKNDVLLGIKIVSKFIAGKNIVIQKGCRTLIDQIQSYAWDQKASDRGEDKPIKKDDHIVDALRYACASAFPTGEFSHPDEELSIDQLRRKVYGNDQMFLSAGTDGYF